LNWAELHCEGYHDRAFLAGWLESRGWKDPGLNGGLRSLVRNPLTQKVVAGGRFAFQFEDVIFLEIIPSEGKDNAVRNACRTLKNSLTDAAPPAWVVVACDLDDEDLEACRQRLQTRLSNSRQPSVPIATATLIWHATGDFGLGVPPEQTLERLVCGALSRAHLDRGQIVQDWLAATGNPEPSPKSYSWSHMAGWYARHGCERFFRQVWSEKQVRAHLETLLADCSAQELTALESGSP
jgi:hypothetical protein